MLPSETKIRELMFSSADRTAPVNGVNAEPLISVVVATFNAGATLDRCIQSVRGQTYPHKDLIVIDGGSKDRTVEILRANAETISYWVSEPDHGIYHAWNKALNVVRGDWVYFLGADDYFIDEHVLARVVPHLLNGPSNARVVYGRVDLVRTDGSVIGTFGEPWNRRRFLGLMTLPHQGVFHHRSMFQEHGYFNEEFRIAGDYELLLRELKSHDPVFIADGPIAAMQVGGMSSDGRLSVATLREIKRARDLNGVDAPSFLWGWTLFKASIRQVLSRTLGNQCTKFLVNGYRRLTFRSPV